MNMPAVEVVGLVKKYNNFMILRNINFTVNQGDFVSIMGQSGSGKTTLLNVMSTIDSATSGDVLYNNIKLSTLKGKKLADFRAKTIGIIFQNYNLFDSLTVYENISLPLILQSKSRKYIKNRVYALSDILGVKQLLSKYPREISGGQKQRIAAARSLVADPKILYADEPTGALDSKNSEIFLDLLIKSNKDLNKTIFMVTHSPRAASYSNKVFFIKDGQIFKMLQKEGNMSNKEFYSRILQYIII